MSILQHVRAIPYFQQSQLTIAKGVSRGTKMECQTKDELEQHLSDIRSLATNPALTSTEREAATRAERFAIDLVKRHDTSGHDGKRCPFATRM
jgi:hypothetical protein